MKSAEIKIIRGNSKNKINLFYDDNPIMIEINLDGHKISRTGNDLFECFSTLRAELPDVKFLCKGAKLNVYPSRMTSQMAGGLLAYELTLGKQALRESLVNIFDPEEENIVQNPDEQKDYFMKWINSL
ncbi:hypothetical protein BZL41_10555 [Pseudomonas sp. PIC25]|uniref:hypothetical protein n=1 Tax=Pseudomonas sp. PIC25 TaxID=1958773 RepID=UPI000BD9FA8C|nr:hypothetical protein [Pseudomonas sp. PIC25]PAU64200.1 hypothetical protein BZL41_10555 [Pseudomonas sp. PIC25]